MMMNRQKFGPLAVRVVFAAVLLAIGYKVFAPTILAMTSVSSAAGISPLIGLRWFVTAIAIIGIAWKLLSLSGKLARWVFAAMKEPAVCRQEN